MALAVLLVVVVVHLLLKDSGLRTYWVRATI